MRGRSTHLNRRAKRYAMPKNLVQNFGEGLGRVVVSHQSEAPRGVAVSLWCGGQCALFMQADWSWAAGPLQ
jgi:hypothetical protein